MAGNKSDAIADTHLGVELIIHTKIRHPAG